MPRRLWILVTAALAAVVLLPAAGRADNPVLTGDVGLNDAFRIALTDAGGAAVTHLDPGTYTLVVHDHSNIHDFHLFGPGAAATVDAGTEVEFTGDRTFTITLTDGTYTFHCDPHPTLMKGSFTVGTATPATTTTTTTPGPRPAARLAASVGPGARIALRGTSGLLAGKAVITVKDASRTDNFRLVGPGVNRASGIAFRGTVTWTVTLRAGRYSFRSDGTRRLRGSFTVAG